MSLYLSISIFHCMYVCLSLLLFLLSLTPWTSWIAESLTSGDCDVHKISGYARLSTTIGFSCAGQVPQRPTGAWEATSRLSPAVNTQQMASRWACHITNMISPHGDNLICRSQPPLTHFLSFSCSSVNDVLFHSMKFTNCIELNYATA